MYKTIRQITDMYKRKNNNIPPKTKTKLNYSLNDNLSYIQRRFDNTADLTIHKIALCGVDAGIISINNMVNKELMTLSIIEPMINNFYNKTPEEILYEIKNKILYTDDISVIDTFEQLFILVMSGFAVISVDGCNKMLAVGIQGFRTRGISEPESDVVQRGSKEGFVESVRTNMTLIRRRMKTTDLKFEIINIGQLSSTEVCICYLNGTASKEIISELKKRLNKIDLKTILAPGYIVPYIEDKSSPSFFSTVGITERPDTVCGKITEGRIAVLIDGVPSALIVPYLFAEYFQTIDDYTNRPYFSTFTRWLKYMAFFIAVLLLGVFVALGTFDPEIFPTLLLNKIASSISETPLSLMTETLIIQFVYEIMRESGLRMPQPLGYAVSIVGGLVIGDTAINAGLIGAPTLMVVAVAVISSYVIPNLYAPVVILRLLFTLAGGIFGIWGVSLFLCLTMINLCSKTSFGIPYTSPLTPFGVNVFRDVFVRAGWKTLNKNTAKVQNMPGAEVE